MAVLFPCISSSLPLTVCLGAHFHAISAQNPERRSEKSSRSIIKNGSCCHFCRRLRPCVNMKLPRKRHVSQLWRKKKQNRRASGRSARTSAKHHRRQRMIGVSPSFSLSFGTSLVSRTQTHRRARTHTAAATEQNWFGRATRR